MPSGPKFLVKDLGTVDPGTAVVVNLSGSAANVRLMDSSNYRAYKTGRKHRYHGGLVKRTPHRIIVPSRGHWYVTIDTIGMQGAVRANITVEPPPLPVARSADSVGSLVNIRHVLPPSLAFQGDRNWDVFISHASEDKETVARPICEALKAHGVTAWLDVAELRIGDSLRRSIDSGLARSRFGVVVFSKSFFAKGWPQYELDGIVTRSVSGIQTLLPVWHDITKDELMTCAPSLVDKIARSTMQFTIQEIADEIASVVSGVGVGVPID